MSMQSSRPFAELPTRDGKQEEDEGLVISGLEWELGGFKEAPDAHAVPDPVAVMVKVAPRRDSSRLLGSESSGTQLLQMLQWEQRGGRRTLQVAPRHGES